MNKTITPPKKLNRITRQSNIELFRIIAMFLVLVVHADYFSLQAPLTTEMHANPLSATTRIFWESLSIGCVDMFVLITGWFGIHPKKKSFCNFVFQCLFFLIGIYILCVATGLTTLSLKGIAGCFVMLEWNWFIKSYIGLYILSPILNSYIEHATKQELGRTILFFYIFQTLYSWISNGAPFFMSGYSTMSFIGLYLLAQYAHRYPNCLTSFSPSVDLSIFAGLVAGQTLLGAIALYWDFNGIQARLFSYVSPLVILSALYLLLAFSKLKFSSRIINWVAASSFAVFLLHTNPNLCRPYFIPFVQHIYNTTDSIECLMVIFVFLAFVFFLAILIDQIRILLWNFIWNKWNNKA